MKTGPFHVIVAFKFTWVLFQMSTLLVDIPRVIAL